MGDNATQTRYVRRPNTMPGKVMTSHPASFRRAVNTREIPTNASVPSLPGASLNTNTRNTGVTARTAPAHRLIDETYRTMTKCTAA